MNKIKEKVGIYLDIETSENIGTFYGPLYETRIIEVLEHSHLTSFSVKFVGSRKVCTRDLQDFPLHKKDPKSDEFLLIELTQWIEKADYIIAHNGDGFDIPTVNTRLDYWGLPSLPPEKTIDTLKIARRLWKLPSYSLDFLGQYFSFGRKLERGKGKMKRSQEKLYNAHDVVLLERLFEIIRPHIGNHSAFKEVKEKVVSHDQSCPHCKSRKTQSRGRRVFYGKEVRQFQCRAPNCFKWFTGVTK